MTATYKLVARRTLAVTFGILTDEDDVKHAIMAVAGREVLRRSFDSELGALIACKMWEQDAPDMLKADLFGY